MVRKRAKARCFAKPRWFCGVPPESPVQSEKDDRTPLFHDDAAVSFPIDTDSISLTVDWRKCPSVVAEMRDEADGVWHVLSTAGDGACALHALWGSPRETPAGIELHREDIRDYVVFSESTAFMG